jgi:hypothetical protein
MHVCLCVRTYVCMHVCVCVCLVSHCDGMVQVQIPVKTFSPEQEKKLKEQKLRVFLNMVRG